MKLFSWKYLVLIAIVLIVGACGNEDDKEDNGWPMSTITIKSESLTSGQTSTTYVGNNTTIPGFGGVIFSNGGISIDLYKSYAGSDISQLFHLQTDGAAVQEYPVGGQTYFDYDVLNPGYYSTTGTITITDITAGYVFF